MHEARHGERYSYPNILLKYEWIDEHGWNQYTLKSIRILVQILSDALPLAHSNPPPMLADIFRQVRRRGILRHIPMGVGVVMVDKQRLAVVPRLNKEEI
jgi:hypothetical protein